MATQKRTSKLKAARQLLKSKKKTVKKSKPPSNRSWMKPYLSFKSKASSTRVSSPKSREQQADDAKGDVAASKHVRGYDLREEPTDWEPVRMYLREIKYIPLLTPEEEKTLARQALAGDQKAYHSMIESNLLLVVKIAHRYRHRGLGLSDLIEEGNLGLMHAVNKFNPELNFRFCTYATYWIRQNIERAIMNSARTIRLPVHVHRQLKTYHRAAHELKKNQDELPTVEQIADKASCSSREVHEMLSLTKDVTSIETPMGSDTESTLIHTLVDRNAIDPLDVLQQYDLDDRIDQWLDELKEPYREILLRRFGLHDYQRSTLEEVGKAIGLTRERVRQLQMRALHILRDKMKQQGLLDDESEEG